MANLKSKMRVLLVNRPDNFKVKGGDTMHINRLKTGLEKLGVHVDISTNIDVNPAGYDLINIFNLLIPVNSVRQLSALRMQTRAPIVMTPFYWDMSENIWADAVIPLAVEKAANDAELDLYLQQIDQGILNAGYLGRNTKNLPNLEFEEQQKISLEFVDHLIPISDAEDRIMRKNLPCEGIPSTMIPTGMDLELEEADPNLFIEEYGVKDFVLATGRVEGRKNQLMLLLAMRNTNIPVVIVGSQPDKRYLELCKKIAPPGTIFTGRISYELLKSARAAAKVHCLPSWWECAGIVHLEAGLAGCAVVAGKQAAEPEYLEDHAYYCNPGSVSSIKNAVLLAYNNFEKDASKRAFFKQFLKENFSWDLVAKRTLVLFEKLLQQNNSSSQGSFEDRRFKREIAQAVYHSVRENPAGSILQIEKHKERVNSKPVFLRMAAQQYYLIGQVDQSLEMRKETVNLDPENAVYQISLADELFKLGNYQEVVNTLEKIELNQANSTVTQLLLSEAYIRLNDMPKAIQTLESLIESQPRNARAKSLLAGCYSRSGNPMKANDLYEQASLISERAYYFKQQKGQPTPLEIFQRLSKADDIDKALDENFDYLSIKLVDLVTRAGKSEERKGNSEAAQALLLLAQKTAERIELELDLEDYKLSARERFEALLTSDDIMQALDEHFDWIDADLLKLVQSESIQARKNEKIQYAAAMDNLAEYLEQAIQLKDQYEEPETEEESLEVSAEQILLDRILTSSDPLEFIENHKAAFDPVFIQYIHSQVELLIQNEEFEAAEGLKTVLAVIQSPTQEQAPKPGITASQALEILLSYDDLPKALHEHEDLLTVELHQLVKSLSSEAEKNGENELSTGYRHLAEYIKDHLQLN